MHVRPPDQAWTQPWTEDIGAFLFIVTAPDHYTMLPPRQPLTLHIELLAPSPFGLGDGELAVIGRYAQGDTQWTERLLLRVLINTSRFVHEGFMAIRPALPSGYPHPLERVCPPGLIHAAIADMVQSVRHVLVTDFVRQDEAHGCIYRFRYLHDP
jgi:hypothetical protein